MIPFRIICVGYITEIDTGRIDADYMKTVDLKNI